MIPEGGRLAIGLSGGWDSLALLRLLVTAVGSMRRPVELVAVHVRLDAAGGTPGLGPVFDAWCGELGVELVQVEPRLDPAEEVPLGCFRCAAIRRRTLLEQADARGCSHLALGHHADDVVETWLLALFYTGRGETLPPRRSYFEGAVTLIRPLYEIRRPEIHRLGRLCGFPQPPAACSRSGDARRDRVREVLAALGRDQARVRRQLYWTAMRERTPETESDDALGTQR